MSEVFSLIILDLKLGLNPFHTSFDVEEPERHQYFFFDMPNENFIKKKRFREKS